MKIKMHIQSLPRQVKFPIYAWHTVSPPVQYLDAFNLSDLDTFDADILVYGYVLSNGRMMLEDIASGNNVVSSLKKIQILLPINTTINMKCVLKED